MRIPAATLADFPSAAILVYSRGLALPPKTARRQQRLSTAGKSAFLAMLPGFPPPSPQRLTPAQIRHFPPPRLTLHRYVPRLLIVRVSNGNVPRNKTSKSRAGRILGACMYLRFLISPYMAPRRLLIPRIVAARTPFSPYLAKLDTATWLPPPSPRGGGGVADGHACSPLPPLWNRYLLNENDLQQHRFNGWCLWAFPYCHLGILALGFALPRST
jgi:hypothetical protein